MFDFEELTVYQKAKRFNKSVAFFLSARAIDRVSNDQLRRASLSIMLNIAEGSGRRTAKDQRRFYVMARGSVFECAAIIDHLLDLNKISNEEFISYYNFLQELSKMLYAMIRRVK